LYSGETQATVKERAIPATGDILVVDDDEALGHMVAITLRAEGYAVRRASNAAGAFTAITAQRPALLLLDLMMPDKSGLAVIAELWSAGIYLPIVIMTARGPDARRLVGPSVGYLAKPFTIPELLSCVAQYVQPVS
jgi:DNA-binding response OmpR family regulator